MKYTTEQNYMKILDKIVKNGIDLDNFTIEIFEEKCINQLKNDNIKNLYYNSLLWYIKKQDMNNPYVNILRQIIEKTRSKTLENYRKNELSDNEKQKYVNWEKIMETNTILSKNISSKFGYLEYLICSLYVYNPPRRLEYAGLILNDNIKIKEDDVIIWNDNSKNIVTTKINSIDSPNNYYTRYNNTAFFIFNEYKTNQKYGKQIIEVATELQKIINEYIEKYKIENESIIIKLSRTSLSTKLSNIFEKHLQKKISVSMLRHIYITYLYDNNIFKSEQDKLIICNKMSHSIDTQLLYRKNVD